MNLKREISRLGLLFAAVGGIIGSGWLLGPLYTAKLAGPASILAWLLGGGLMMIIALTFAELAASMPVTGGLVRFTQISHGSFTNFGMAWISWLASVMVAPIETMATLQYVANYFPNLFVNNGMTQHLSLIGIIAASVLMFLMCVVNFFGVRLFAKSNNAMVFWKLIIPVAAAIILFSHHFSPANFTHFEGFAPYGLKGILVTLPTAGVIFSFIGYSPAILLASETKNPQKSIPFAIIGSICIAALIYIMIQTAFIAAVDTQSLAHGWANLSFKGDSGPIAGLIAAFGLGWFLQVIYVGALISPVGTGYIYTAATARINMAMSKNGYMPESMEKVNKHGAPWLAILVNYFVGMLFFLPFPGWQDMVGFLVSCFVITYAIGPISCVALRELLPDLERPFKVPCCKMFCLLAFYLCNLIIYWTGWGIIWKMLTLIGIGYIVLLIQHNLFKNKAKEALDVAKGIWMLPYLLGLGIISYLGAFQGIEVIKFGYDFIVIGIFSVLIFWLALHCALSYRRPVLEEKAASI